MSGCAAASRIPKPPTAVTRARPASRTTRSARNGVRLSSRRGRGLARGRPDGDRRRPSGSANARAAARRPAGTRASSPAAAMTRGSGRPKPAPRTRAMAIDGPERCQRGDEERRARRRRLERVEPRVPDEEPRPAHGRDADDRQGDAEGGRPPKPAARLGQAGRPERGAEGDRPADEGRPARDEGHQPRPDRLAAERVERASSRGPRRPRRGRSCRPRSAPGRPG